MCVHPKLLIYLAPTTCFLSLHRHLYSSLFSHYLWTEKTNSRKVVTQTQNPEYKHPLLTHRLEMGRFWDFPLPKNAYANSASHSHLLKAKLALPAEVGGSQECVTDSDTSLLGQEMEGDWDSYFFPFSQMPVGENLMCPVWVSHECFCFWVRVLSHTLPAGFNCGFN